MKDPTEEYETTKEYIRQKFEENPELTESDTKLFLDILEDATGLVIPVDVDVDDLPKVGSVTRASRKLRREEGYEDLARDEVTEARDNKEEEMEDKHSGNSEVLMKDGNIVP